MKTYKGIELFKAVANYELKHGTKLKCTHYPTYGQGIEVAENKSILIWSDTKEPVDYLYFNDKDFEFKIIEEEKPKKTEKFSIAQKMKTNYGIEYKLSHQEFFIQEKINELGNKVNYLLEKESDK